MASSPSLLKLSLAVVGSRPRVEGEPSTLYLVAVAWAAGVNMLGKRTGNAMVERQKLKT